MTIDVAKYRAKMDDIGALFGESVNAPGVTDERRLTYPVITCIMLLAIYERLGEILDKIEDD